MFPANAKLNELLAILDVLSPASQSAGTVTTPNWIYVGNVADQFQAMIDVGAMGTNGTVDASIRQATSSGGAGAKAVPNKALSQVQQAASGANTVSCIDFRGQDLDTNNGFDYVQISITVAVAACTVGAKLLGSGRFEPVNAATGGLNSAAVLQQV